MNFTVLTKAVDVAKELFTEQTDEDLQELKQHFVQAYAEAEDVVKEAEEVYDEVKIIVAIAVELAMRFLQRYGDAKDRALSKSDELPELMSRLVEQGLERM